MGNEQSSTKSPQNKNKETGGIVVVANSESNTSSSTENPHVERLQYCPSFLPILKSAIVQEGGKFDEADLLGGLNNEAVLNLCLILQNYLHDCSQLVAKDQNKLAEKIKRIDLLANTLMQNYTERQKKFAKYAEYTKKIEDTATLLRKIRMNLDHTLSIVHNLNEALPENEQLEKFE